MNFLFGGEVIYVDIPVSIAFICPHYLVTIDNREYCSDLLVVIRVSVILGAAACIDSVSVPISSVDNSSKTTSSSEGSPAPLVILGGWWYSADFVQEMPMP